MSFLSLSLFQVAMEHRFYGETIPGNDSSTANLKYLSSQQALADSAAFHHIITKQYQTPDSRWVTTKRNTKCSTSVIVPVSLVCCCKCIV